MQSEKFDDIFKRLEDTYKQETEALKVQLESLTKQNEALHEHVLGKKDYMESMERQTAQLLAAIESSRAVPVSSLSQCT